jgi:hypothetical protein
VGAGHALPRGGKRTGAGAPIGNLNGLKNGRRSRQLKALYADLALHPVFRNLLLRQHMKHISRPSRARLRRLYLELLARLIASRYIQSNGVPLSSFQSTHKNEKSPNNQNPTLSDLIHNPPRPTPCKPSFPQGKHG